MLHKHLALRRLEREATCDDRHRNPASTVREETQSMECLSRDEVGHRSNRLRRSTDKCVSLWRRQENEIAADERNRFAVVDHQQARTTGYDEADPLVPRKDQAKRRRQLQP